MSIYNQGVRGLNRAPYRDQVIIHLLRRHASDRLSAAEEAKIARVQRFLPAVDCAYEIETAREKAVVGNQR